MSFPSPTKAVVPLWQPLHADSFLPDRFVNGESCNLNEDGMAPGVLVLWQLAQLEILSVVLPAGSCPLLNTFVVALFKESEDL